jgi:glutamine amidotransferase
LAKQGLSSSPPATPEALLARRTEAEPPLAWGMGFYQAGEVLLRRRPIDDRLEVSAVEVAENVATDLLIGHVRRPVIGPLRTENTQPFRYRNWLFAHTGTLTGFEQFQEALLLPQPDFLQRSRRGETDSEVLFYLFLTTLHETGELQQPAVSAGQIRSALKTTMTRLDAMAQEAGFPRPSGDIVVTNGEALVTLHRSGTLSYKQLAGEQDTRALLLGDERGGSTHLSGLERARCSVLATGLSEAPEGWQHAPTDTILTLTRTEAPVVEQI